MSQNSLTLPTTGTVSGLQMTQYANNALDTLNSLASGASAPSSPEAGQLWHDTTNNILKLRSLDNTQWIPLFYLNETAYLAGSPSLGQINANANRLINGAMLIDQANEGASVTLASGNAAYITDQWAAQYTSSTASGVAAQRVSDAPAGFTSSLKVTVGTGASSVASGDFLIIDQPIEGYNVADLGFGGSNAVPVSLSFWVKSSVTGTFCATIQNGAFNRSYISSFTITATGTWQKITLPNLPGDVAGTWNVNASSGMVLLITVASGATYQSAAGTWVGSNSLAVSTQTNAVLTTSGATFQLTGAMLNAGAFCTPFEKKLFSAELEACQRYYEKSYDIGTAPGASGNTPGIDSGVASTGAFVMPNIFKVTKRADPSITFYSPSSGTSGKVYDVTGSTDISGWTAFDIGMKGSLIGVATATASHQYEVHWTASARY